jgi:RimJ/RimL family protein N-acetyltransferase
MTYRRAARIDIEELTLKRLAEFHAAVSESGKEWFAAGVLPQPDLSIDELEGMLKVFLELLQKDDNYMFYVLDADTDQVVGTAFLNHVNRMHQMANLGYAVRTSRAGEGIATQAAKLAARYGFEKLGFQRLEIVVSKDNTASLRVAEKVGAVREGLLRNRLLLHGSPSDAYMHALIPADLGIRPAS